MQLTNQPGQPEGADVIYLNSLTDKDILFIHNHQALLADGIRREAARQLASYATFNGEAINRTSPNSGCEQKSTEIGPGDVISIESLAA